MGFCVFIITFLAIDLLLLSRKAHRVSFRSALLQTIFWVTMAMVFAALVYVYRGSEESFQFIAAYFTEESLSVDNMFVFILILRYFNVEEKYYHKVLFYGVFGAIVFRALFILAGSFLIAQFHWILYLFGAILFITGLRLLFTDKEDKFDAEKNIVYRLLKKYFLFSTQPAEGRFLVKEGGKTLFSSLFLVVAMIETTDIVFALDSIPAVFLISQSQFVVYTSNIFAIMGLRALFFLVSGMMNKFHFLKQGISFILMFIGVKMLFEIFDFKLSTTYSLLTILCILAASILMSLVIPEKKK
jgi:tellurite resistance protein TerC